MEGRVTQQVEAYDGTTSLPLSASSVTASTDRATNWTYDGLGHILTLEAVMPTGTNSQTTQYVYAVSTSGVQYGSGHVTIAGASTFNSNDVLACVMYPDAGTGTPANIGSSGTGSPNLSECQQFTYNNLGQQSSYTDQNGTVHSYSYDLLGRRTTDAVTVASGNPQNVDTTVLCQTMNFDTGDRPYQMTTYNATSGGSVVNQVEELYNGLSQLTNEYQEHNGAVNTSSSLQVQYAYTQMSGGANNSNPISMTYPNGRVLHYVYNSGLDRSIGRVSALADDDPHNPGNAETPHLEDYSYLGLKQIVLAERVTSDLELSYVQVTGDSHAIADAGDQYTGLDRFGRVIDQNWIDPFANVSEVRYQYGYDRDGNALYKNDLQVTGLSELYHANSAGSGDNATGYDNLSRLINFTRGTLSASGNNGTSGTLGSLDTVSSASSLSRHQESWSLDTLGNWASQTTDGAAVNRLFNSKNEMTLGPAGGTSYDNNGNATLDGVGVSYIYDAWNRCAQASNSVGTQKYRYDATGRRVSDQYTATYGGGSGTTDYYFDHQWQNIEDRQSSTVVDQYVWGQAYVDALVLRDDNSTSGDIGINGSGLGRRLFVDQDANWNTVGIHQMSDQPVERFVYDPYGNVQALTNAGASTTDAYNWVYLHQGGRMDSITSDYIFRHRDYSPALGRWLQQDPLGYVDGADLYIFEKCDPLFWMDPLGTGGMYVGGGWVTWDDLPPPPSAPPGPPPYDPGTGFLAQLLAPLVGPKNGSDELGCVARCVSQHDPANLLGNAAGAAAKGLSAALGAYPKSAANAVGLIPRTGGIGGAPGEGVVTGLTNNLSVLTTNLGGARAVGRGLRLAGDVASTLATGYNLALAGIELDCLRRCHNCPTAY